MPDVQLPGKQRQLPEVNRHAGQSMLLGEPIGGPVSKDTDRIFEDDTCICPLLFMYLFIGTHMHANMYAHVHTCIEFFIDFIELYIFLYLPPFSSPSTLFHGPHAPNLLR